MTSNTAAAIRARVAIAVAVAASSAAACCAGGATNAEVGDEAEVVAAEVAATETVEAAAPPEDDPNDPMRAPTPPLPECFLGVPDGSGGCIVTPEDRRATMSPALRWQHVQSSCPDPLLGSFADLWVWEPPDAEAALVAHDLAGDGTTFGLLADYEGTSIIIRVRDAETNDSMGVIKTTSSNTRVNAEVYAWRLANFLGFGDLVPPVLPVELAGGALRKMRDVLAAITYDDAAKESNRQRVVRELDAALSAGQAYHGAYKPWLRAFMFHGGLGDRDLLANQSVMDHLVAAGSQPGDEAVTLSQYTRLYSPRGTHRGQIAMWQLAEDLSNILLMDALMGQNDRFAGANLHFRSVAGTEREDGARNGSPIFEMGAVRLLALDNGAAMRGRNGAGILDLRGEVVAGTRVERFDRESVARLRALARRTMGRGCDQPAYEDEAVAIWAWLGVDGDEASRAADYLTVTLDYIDQLEDRYGDAIWLTPRLDVGGEALIEGDDGALAEDP